MPIQLKIFPEKCSGCRSCELVCPLVNDGELNPSKSRITVISFLEGSYSLPYNFPSTCKQCADAPCMTVCPVDAISRTNDKIKVITIDNELCTHCKQCVKACPFGAMLFDREKKLPYKCELCAGEPACTSICPTEAIVFVNRKPFYSKTQSLQMQAFAFLSERNREVLKNS